jgi:hypothetical protein
MLLRTACAIVSPPLSLADAPTDRMQWEVYIRNQSLFPIQGK